MFVVQFNFHHSYLLGYCQDGPISLYTCPLNAIKLQSRCVFSTLPKYGFTEFYSNKLLVLL